MKLFKAQSKTILQKSFRAALALGEHAFLGFLVLLTISLILASLVFYRYVLSLENVAIDALEQSGFQDAKFHGILRIWEERSIGFDAAGAELGRDIFTETAPADNAPDDNPRVDQ